MKKLLILILMFILLFSMVKSKRLILLPELTNPSMITVDGDKVYVVEGAMIFVYSIENLTLLDSFGKKGNGPGEFNPNPSFDMNLELKILTERLFLSTPRKLAFFDPSGNLQKEKRFSFYTTHTEPCGNGYVVNKFFQQEQATHLGVILMDSNLNQLAILEKIEYPYKVGEFEPIREYFGFKVYEDKVFVINGKRGLSIWIFSKDGDKISSMKREYQRIKFNESHKKLTWEWLKRKNWFKMIPPEYKKQTIFPSQLPLCKDFFVDSKKIYIHTFNEGEDGSEFLIVPINGSETMTVTLPVTGLNLFESLPYTIKNQQFYYLIENTDEDWELHRVEIKN